MSLLHLSKISLEDMSKFTEFMFVNSISAFLVVHWGTIVGAFQVILILSTIAYNATKLYDWYISKFKQDKSTKEKNNGIEK